ncbi:hypothetical protein D3C85_720970 [compost metagenome]
MTPAQCLALLFWSAWRTDRHGLVSMLSLLALAVSLANLAHAEHVELDKTLVEEEHRQDPTAPTLAGLPRQFIKGEALWQREGWYASPTVEWVPNHYNVDQGDPLRGWLCHLGAEGRLSSDGRPGLLRRGT